MDETKSALCPIIIDLIDNDLSQTQTFCPHGASIVDYNSPLNASPGRCCSCPSTEPSLEILSTPYCKTSLFGVSVAVVAAFAAVVAVGLLQSS